MNQLFNLLSPLPLYLALKNSLNGLGLAVKSERAFQQEAVLMVVGGVAAFLLTDVSTERALLIGSLAIVLIVELVNSAIEAVVDRIGTEINPLSKRAKDLGSAAVLLSLVTAGVIWVIILV
jgi:diacylglycerol kinase (ATP)